MVVESWLECVHLTAQNLDCVGWMWGDGQVLPDVLPKLVHACSNGIHLAKAERTKRKDGLLRKVISKGYSIAMKSTPADSRDINGCPKIFRLDAWERLTIESQDWFLDAEVVLESGRHHFQIHQEPVTMQPRQYNQSKVNVRTVLGDLASTFSNGNSTIENDSYELTCTLYQERE